MKECPSRYRELVTAVIAVEHLAGLDAADRGALAPGANDAFGPAQLFQIAPALGVGVVTASTSVSKSTDGLVSGMAAKRKKARELTTDEVMARIFGRMAAKTLRQLVEGDNPLKSKQKRAPRKKS